jgi:hypothetical protein
MIPRAAQPAVMRLDPRELVVLESDHVAPVDPWAIDHYAHLLLEPPDADTDPLLVVIDSEGRKRVRRGRHRYLANLQAGRAYVLAMVYHDTGAEH